MRITILTWGTSGDVIPYIALALGLKDRNHEVTLAATENFSELIKSHGISYMPLHGDSQKLFDSEEGRKWIAAGNVRSFMRELVNIFTAMKIEIRATTLAACSNTEAIICGTLMNYFAAVLSEKLNVPMMVANVNPVSTRTKAFPHFIVSPKDLGIGALNAFTYTLCYKSIHRQAIPDAVEWRNELGLDSQVPDMFDQMVKLKTPVIYGYSNELLPKPADWRDNIQVSGVWKAPAGHRKTNPPSPLLISWLNAGTPPVYLGFGSMPVSNPAEIQKMFIEICKEEKVRGIIHAGWSKFNAADATNDASIFYLTEFIDFDWLFPKCSTLVHHGGVGTTHLGLEAGVPAVICSIFADNQLWGEQLKKMGAGRHIRFKNLTKPRLTKAIKDLQKEGIRQKAAAIGRRIKEENGLKNAVDFIETNLPKAAVYNSSI